MKQKLKYGFQVAAMLLTAFFAQRCANVVAPTGGPKDDKPPVVVEAVPENHSTGFSGRKIELTFDEYVVLENANQNVLISPPVSTKPDIKLHGKTLSIKFKEALEADITYTIHFGAAIKDLHEGNLFKDYVFSFSTGDYIDTLSIAGKVLSAEEKKPVEDALVGLYSSDRVERVHLDSMPLSVPPNYLAKTDKEGRFRFSGIADKKYLVFALKDVNANLYFDLPNEQVAFLDTLVEASYPQTPIPVMTDTIAADTLALDSTAVMRCFDPNSLDLTLYMFTETDSTQVLLEKKLVEEGLLRFVFRHPAKDAVIMTPEHLPDSFNLVTMHSPDYDTVWWYFTPNVKDSLWVQVKYDTVINDSSRYSLKFKESGGNRMRNREPEKLKVGNNLIGRGGLIEGHELTLTFSEPIVKYVLSDSIPLKCDTTPVYNAIAFEQTDNYGLKYSLKTPVEKGVNYSFELPDSVFFGIRRRTNGPIKAEFHVLTDDEYGNIYITIAPPVGMRQVVVQLTDESGKKVLKEEIISHPEEVMFGHLAPTKYRLRAILDADGNGKWSTGNYHRRTLPEVIIEYKDPLEIRAGWDIDLEEVWDL